MRAAYFDKTGSPDVIRIGEMPKPTPKAGEVLVKIHVAGLNPIDTYIRSGAVPMKIPMPFIPGCDLAGEVEALGAGVTNFNVGQRVWASNQGLLGRQGTFAEYAAVDAAYLYPIPQVVDYAHACAAALTGITAHLGLFRCGKLEFDETVFVNGGTGGVGSMVVMLAKIAGASVITTVGSDEKAELAQKIGADHVLNYRTADIAKEVKEITHGRGVQLWFETQREPNFLQIVDLVSPNGRIVVMAGRTAQPVFPVGPFYVKGLTMSGFAMFNIPPDEQRVAAEFLNENLLEGNLSPLIGKEFPLEEAAAAHQLQEENTLKQAGTLTGKILIRVVPE